MISVDPFPMTRPFSRALVTGSAGFLGRALSSSLTKCGVIVTGIDLQDHAEVQLDHFHKADLLNFQALREIVSNGAGGEPDNCVVFHLAGQSHKDKCRNDPDSAFERNIAGTGKLLESCRLAGIKRVIFPSTALVYSIPRNLPIKERDPVAARCIYTATKLASENLLAGYAGDYGFSCLVARLGNVYAANGHADSIVTILSSQITAGADIVIRRLSPIRDFVYREDVVDALIAMGKVSSMPGLIVCNIASGMGTSIRDLALALCRVKGVAPTIRETNPASEKEKDHVVLSINRIHELTGWRPKWSLEEGLRNMLAEQ